MPRGAPSPAIDAFIDHLRVERRLSPRTLQAYREDLTQLGQFLAPGAEPDWRVLAAAQLRAFVAAQHQAGISGKSLARRLSACRSFYRWLLREGRASANPAAGLRAPKSARKLPNVLDADEMAAFLELADAAPLVARDRAMLELFYSSALRLTELTRLCWRDLDLADGLVRVTGKGSKARLVPVGAHARRALAAWRAESAGGDAAPVFPGRGGAPISARAVQARLPGPSRGNLSCRSKKRRRTSGSS